MFASSVAKTDGASVNQICGEMGFAVPTFNDALDEMMEETIQLQK